MNAKKRFLSLLLAIVTLLTLLPTVALAETAAEKAIVLTSTSHKLGGIDEWEVNRAYDQVYYGQANGSPILWNVLDDQTNQGELGMLMHAAQPLAQVSYDAGVQSWQSSSLRSWCLDFAGQSGSAVADAFTAKELAAIMAVSMDDPAYTSTSGSVAFAAAKNNLNADKVFFLSAKEAEINAYGFTSDPARRASVNGSYVGWWLRSNKADTTTGYVGSSGAIAASGSASFFYARPAMNIARSSILFTAQAGAKADGNGFAAVADASDDAIYTLTVLDSSRTFTAAANVSQLEPGQTLTVTYENAAVGANEYVSVILADENDQALYYGRLKNVAAQSDASGSLDITIPESLPFGSYKLCVFNEQYNGGTMTDYASALSAIALTVDDVQEPLLELGSGQFRTDEGATAVMRFISSEAGTYYYKVMEKGQLPASHEELMAASPGEPCAAGETAFVVTGL
ncbi:MAG: hypothetical protein IJP03_05385, partial [Christensenellaceae bacterium]|nr:hypothetical protein [Christensenellaceae bacterium]